MTGLSVVVGVVAVVVVVGDVVLVVAAVEVAVEIDVVGLAWRDFVDTDPALHRPVDIDVLSADPTAAEQALGWTRQGDFEEMVRRMVTAELRTFG